MDLQEQTIDLLHPCDIYNNLITLFQNKKEKIEQAIERGGTQKEKIMHGDYGYFPYNGNKIVRLFGRTRKDRIEAFCTKHFDKCRMRADVNKNPKQYFICGNLLSDK